MDRNRPSAPRSGEPFDLLIRGGTVIDGSGAPAFRADVAVRGDRIAAVGPVEGGAKRVIDAQGLVVAPGFVDVHAHDDVAVMSTPMDFKLMQGVTTDIVGNCGTGVAPADEPVRRALEAGFEATVLGPVPAVRWRTFGEYMRAVEESRPAVNVGCLVPHGVVRTCVLLNERRAPEPAELEAMRERVAEGMAAGALGLSTGLIYEPGRYAQTPEIIALAKVSAASGGVYVSHIRNEAERLLEAVAEAATIGQEAGLPVQISHHKAAGRPNWGRTAASIRYIEEQRSQGQDITFDVYPYTAGSTILAAMNQVTVEDEDPSEVLVASVRGHPEYEGKRLPEIGQMLGV
ncbi:MAG TPA: amidohydrolase family protein, partial [Dehalococcoidia bacterium]|nr:amidohydrolase family protein [Dehalococcoidia bacterium]